MIIVLSKGAGKRVVEVVSSEIEARGLAAHVSRGKERTIIGAIGDERLLNVGRLKSIPGVEKVIPILAPYKLASREFHPEDTTIEVKGTVIGGEQLVVVAGPCAIESEEQMVETARAVKEAGATILRGSAFKPRTSPYDFQGMGEDALKILRRAGEEAGLPVETEVMDTRQVAMVAKHVDILRIGARNMQNFDLLKEVGKTNKPVILKNGIASTLKEFLMAAEYIMSEGNDKVILCNRGIRSFEAELRFPVLVGSTALLKQKSHLPVLVDPSHSTGNKSLISAASRAAVAEGADGLIVEVHNCPEKALCDAAQQLEPRAFAEMMQGIRGVAAAVGRRL
jgi:3-deoxy-7-phosphoheptulonate synthase